MINAPQHDPTDRTAACLEWALRELEGRTKLPLRVVAHAAASSHQTFEFEEEHELGTGGRRRFLVSVDDARRDLLVVVLPPDPGDRA